MENNNPYNLTDKQLKYIINHYKHTRNEDLCEKFNLSPFKLQQIRRKYELAKSKIFMNKAAKRGSDAAKIVNKANGYPQRINLVTHREKANKNAQKALKRKRNNKEWFDEWNRKKGESLSNTFKAEKRRVLFGLEQKTKLKVTKASGSKREFRHALRKKGYIVPRNSNVAYYNNQTNRSTRLENNAKNHYITIKEQENYGTSK